MKNEGFTAGYKPPASYFNNFMNKTYESIIELQQSSDTLDQAIEELIDKGVSIENAITSLATVSKTGSYNDLKDKPTKLSQFTNDSGYVVSSSLATVSKTGSYNDLKDKPTTISNADTVDGKHASEFYNISPVGISTTTNPTTLTNGIYTVEGSLYVSDGFPVTCWDHATIYISGYHGVEDNKGYRVIRYVSAWYDVQGEYVKTQIWDSNHWTDWIKVGDSGNADKLQGYSYQNILDSIKQHRTEIIIRSYDTSSDVKGYSYADYTCTSTNARTVIQNAINNAGKGSVIRLLPGTYKIIGGSIEISRDITIVGSGNSTNIVQLDSNNVFKISAGNTTLKDFMFTTSDSNTAKSLLYGNDNNELKDAIFDNVFFIINNSCDNAIASSVIKYCRFKSCRIFRSTTNDYITITFKNGSRNSIINDMFNTGNGYFNIYIESSSDASSIKYSNNHRSRVKIANGSYTII